MCMHAYTRLHSVFDYSSHLLDHTILSIGKWSQIYVLFIHTLINLMFYLLVKKCRYMPISGNVSTLTKSLSFLYLNNKHELVFNMLTVKKYGAGPHIKSLLSTCSTCCRLTHILAFCSDP